MNKILSNTLIANQISILQIEDSILAKNTRAGNFIIVRMDEKGERIPLTVFETNPKESSISLIVEHNGKTAEKLASLKAGDFLADVLGPLGTAHHIEHFGTVCCVGDESGVAALCPTIEALKEAGNKVIAVIARTNDAPFSIAEKVRNLADETLEITKGDDVDVFARAIENVFTKESVHKCYMIAEPSLMRACSDVAKEHEIPTTVSLYSTMLDGTGMCGACRISVDGRMKFSCIDGPNFDAFALDWDEVERRAVKAKKIKKMAGERKSDSAKVEIETASKCVNKNVSPTDEPIEVLLDREAQWRKDLRGTMKPKERMAMERTPMPVLDPDYRITTRMEEVNQGFTAEMAMLEAKRCLDCAKPTCVIGCPANNNIPSFIKNIERGDFLAAAEVLKTTTSLPAVCGRVCPQEEQCEGGCIHLKMKRPAVAIGALERFVADYERSLGYPVKPKIAPKNGIKVAAVGSGPAGLSFANDMAKNGFEVHVFEALHELGGVLKYGIPEFRLPNYVVDSEVEKLKEMGVKFHSDCVIGKTVTVDELKADGFKGIFVGTGAGVPNFMNIPGENLINIYSANEFLMRVNLMDADNPETDTNVKLGKRVVVVGGGNTAMDSCATARRLGAEVSLVYRRSEEEMPACLDERTHIKEEGVKFMTLHNPKEYIADENGCVAGVVLDVMELGEPDESGRRRPKTTGRTITIECDEVIVAVGVSSNPLVPKTVEGLEMGKWGNIITDETQKSSLPEIYAGGDVVRGGATVILAMGDGKRAALNMSKNLLA